MSRADDIVKEAEEASLGCVAEDQAARAARLKAKSLEARYNESLKIIDEQRQRIDVLTGLSDKAKAAKWSRPAKRAKGNASAVLLLSDWHVEEVVDPATINGLNEFNLGIAEESIKRVFANALALLDDARGMADIRQLVVWLGGDFISGYIHEELAEGNSLAPLPATRWAAQRIEAGLRMLARESGVEQIVVPTSWGNHGRTTPKMRCATAGDNSFEQNMYYSLRDKLHDEPLVHFQIGEGYHNLLEVQGHLCRFHHGDDIRYQGGVGGLSIPANKKIAAWNKSRRVAYDFFGHWHQFSWPALNWVSNGSLIGYAPFALKIGAEWQPPYQAFAVIDRHRGMTRALPVFCR